MHMTRLISLCRNTTILRSRSCNQVRFFRHQPEDVSRPLGRPEMKAIKQSQEIPVQEAKIISSPVTGSKHFKELVKQYGPVAFGCFIFVSLTNLALCVLAVKMGLGPQLGRLEAVAKFMEKYPSAQTGSEFVLAYALHKVLAPLRYLLTGAMTPLVVNFLRKKGWLKKLYKKS